MTRFWHYIISFDTLIIILLQISKLIHLGFFLVISHKREFQISNGKINIEIYKINLFWDRNFAEM